MNDVQTEFSTKYRQALTRYLSVGGEAPLHQGYELGRESLTEGIGLLGLIEVHYAATVSAFKGVPTPDLKKLRAAGYFLLESLSPYQMLNLGHQESNAALRRLNEILEEEAKRIAHALHDEAAQLLATAYLDIAEISRDAPSDAVRQQIGRLKTHLDKIREQLRQLSHELRSPLLDQLGLLPALKYLAEGFEKRTGVSVNLDSDDMHPDGGRFPQAIETALYRATQEAFSNIARHAHATRVNARIWTANHVVNCKIRDNGVGFAVTSDKSLQSAPKGLGLLGVRERVNSLYGTLTIDSIPGKGTELLISIPYKEYPDNEKRSTG